MRRPRGARPWRCGRGGVAVLAAAGVVGCGRVGYEPARIDACGRACDDAAAPDAVAPDADYCAQVPALAAVPVIDGVLDEGAVLVPLAPQGWTGARAIPAGHAGRWAVAWRDDGIYFFVEVRDATREPPAASAAIYCGDGVEVYVDDDGRAPRAPGYDNPGAVQCIVAAPPRSGSTTPRGERFRDQSSIGPWVSTRYGAFASPGGYVVEAFVTAADLGLASWSLAAGRSVGLDVGVNVGTTAADADACGGRVGQYFLRVVAPQGSACGQPFCDTRAFCTPQLVAR